MHRPTRPWPRERDHGLEPCAFTGSALSCTKCGQLILRKIITTVAIRCHVLRLKCAKFNFSWGSAPDPTGGAPSIPSKSVAEFQELHTAEYTTIFFLNFGCLMNAYKIGGIL